MMIEIPWPLLVLIYLAGGLSGWVTYDWITDRGDDDDEQTTPVEEIR